mmetsp:Transcript_28852/g.92931  ORF Transcript_28852/g.92931 Transcript_28852/m.92931 type:complete len:231 (+) Transcript_28852:245-937(+)
MSSFKLSHSLEGVPFRVLEVEGDEDDAVGEAEDAGDEAEGFFLDAEVEEGDEDDEEALAHGVEEEAEVAFELEGEEVHWFDLRHLEGEPDRRQEEEVEGDEDLRQLVSVEVAELLEGQGPRRGHHRREADVDRAEGPEHCQVLPAGCPLLRQGRRDSLGGRLLLTSRLPRRRVVVRLLPAVAIVSHRRSVSRRPFFGGGDGRRAGGPQTERGRTTLGSSHPSVTKKDTSW